MKMLQSLTVISALFSLTLAANASVIAHWGLDELVGSTAAEAIIGNDGTYHNAYLGTAGVIGSAVGFSSDGHVAIPHSDAYLLDEGTLQFWFKDTGTIRNAALFSKDSMDFDTGGHLTITTTSEREIKVRLQSTSESYCVGSGAFIVLDEWYQVTFSWGAAGMALYVGDDLVDTNPYGGGLGSTSGGIGNYEPIALAANTRGSGDRQIYPLDQHFSGMIDEVLIYNTVIPEPATVGLLAIGGVALLRRRRR